VPPRPTARSVITEAKDWPLANAWRGNEMRVGTTVYQWLKERRQQLSFLFTYNTDQAWAWPEMGLVQEVLRDEALIPFHVVLDGAYSETAHLADLILPWATWMECWDIDSRPPLGLVDYVGLRQPVVKPLGEAKDVRDIFPELARRIGSGMEEYFPWKTTEAYLEAYFKPVPGGLAYMRQHGVWMDPQKAPNYRPYERALTAAELDGSTTDPATGIIYKGEDAATKQPRPIGVMVQGVARRGFSTPTRKLEVDSQFVKDKGHCQLIAC
jgi:thiosulfate reductase / polysulfide reductase chain A